MPLLSVHDHPGAACRRLLTAGWLLAALGLSGAPADQAPSPKLLWVFDLLPKSLQKAPRLDLTVITEMTEEGKKHPAVDVQHPAYFVAQSAGYHRTAEAPAGERTLPPATLDAFVHRSLATRGYYPADTGQGRPPTLALVYLWGVHGRPAATETLSATELAMNIRDRAALVGGEKFARELLELMSDAGAQSRAAVPTQRLTVDGESVPPILGPEQLAFMNPVERFREASADNEFLLEQVGGDVYYVVISAYDYAELARNRRVLLWRTRMTASAAGVAQVDALPTLIRSAAPYLGRDMDGPALLTPRAISSEGQVEIGPMEVKEEDVRANDGGGRRRP